LGTALGAGLLPVAPGSFGTLVGVPISYWTNPWPLFPRLILWTALFAAGTWAAKVFDLTMDSKDNQNIVIDEVVGYGITAWTAGTHWPTLIAAFVVFRIFDVIKPPPIRQVDRWSHRQATGVSAETAAWWDGFGVMADDALAGIFGLIVIVLAQHLHLLP